MAQEYQITAVSGETRDFTSRFGTMRSYKVKFRNYDHPVEITQKLETPAPQEGQTVTGTIEQGKFGPKFKKEYTQGGFSSGGNQTAPATTEATNQKSSPVRGSAGYEKKDDQFTFYLSYAKDLAVASVYDGKFDKELFADLLEEVITGGVTLFNNRPGNDETKSEEADDEVAMKKEVADFFADPGEPYEPSEEERKAAMELFDKPEKG